MYQINVIPEIDCFAHATWLTNLTMPRHPDGTPKSQGEITTEERKFDFAMYDKNNKRMDDCVNLTEQMADGSGESIGSKVVKKLIKTFVSYWVGSFDAGHQRFSNCDISIRGDEYMESLS
jgi:hypothetical protein